MAPSVNRMSSALVALLLAASLSACGNNDSPEAAPSAGVVQSAPSAPAPTETKVPQKERQADALAPKDPQVVLRSGKTPKPKYTSSTAAFGTSVEFKDGLAVEVVKIVQGKVEGEGPGVFTGDPKTTFTLRFDNRTSKPIDLNQVVVNVTYGKPPRVARPTYGETARDFYGTVKPGAKAEATYAFSIPTNELDSVRLRVDFDGTHTPVTFSGAAKS